MQALCYKKSDIYSWHQDMHCINNGRCSQCIVSKANNLSQADICRTRPPIIKSPHAVVSSRVRSQCILKMQPEYNSKSSHLNTASMLTMSSQAVMTCRGKPCAAHSSRSLACHLSCCLQTDVGTSLEVGSCRLAIATSGVASVSADLDTC